MEGWDYASPNCLPSTFSFHQCNKVSLATHTTLYVALCIGGKKLGQEKFKAGRKMLEFSNFLQVAHSSVKKKKERKQVLRQKVTP